VVCDPVPIPLEEMQRTYDWLKSWGMLEETASRSSSSIWMCSATPIRRRSSLQGSSEISCFASCSEAHSDLRLAEIGRVIARSQVEGGANFGAAGDSLLCATDTRSPS